MFRKILHGIVHAEFVHCRFHYFSSLFILGILGVSECARFNMID